MTASELVHFMNWQNRNAEKLIRQSDYKIAHDYLASNATVGSIATVTTKDGKMYDSFMKGSAVERLRLIDESFLMNTHDLEYAEAKRLKEYCFSRTIKRKECYGDGSTMFRPWIESEMAAANLKIEQICNGYMLTASGFNMCTGEMSACLNKVREILKRKYKKKLGDS